jgi:hypothetical protein
MRVIIVLIGLFIIACFVFDHYVQFRKPDEELKRIFAEQHINATIHYYNTHGRTLRYVSAGNDSLPVLLMLHGSPGSISFYSRRFSDSMIKINSGFMQLTDPVMVIPDSETRNLPFSNNQK